MIRIYQVIIDAAGLPEWMMWLSIPVGIITTGLIISLILRVTNRETGDHDASNVVPNKAAPEFPASTTAKEAQLYPWEEATPKKSKKPILIGGGVCALLAVAAVAVLALLLTGNESALTAATVPAAQGTPPVLHATDPLQTGTQPNAATPDPDHIKELGRPYWFFGQALAEANRGADLFDQGDYHGAIQAYQSAQIHHGKPSSVLENRIGMVFQFLDDHQQAIVHLTKAIEIEDNRADRTNRAFSYSETGQCLLAVNDAEQALEMKPESTVRFRIDVNAHKVLRNCHFAIGDYPQAVENARAALKLMETHQYTGEKIAEIHIGLGNALYADDRAAEAIQHYSQAIVLGDTAVARASRAWAYIETKDCASAQADSHKALEMPAVSGSGYHSGAHAHNALAYCYANESQWEKALQHEESSLRLMYENHYEAGKITMTEEDVEFLRTKADQ